MKTLKRHTHWIKKNTKSGKEYILNYVLIVINFEEGNLMMTLPGGFILRVIQIFTCCLSPNLSSLIQTPCILFVKPP